MLEALADVQAALAEVADRAGREIEAELTNKRRERTQSDDDRDAIEAARSGYDGSDQDFGSWLEAMAEDAEQRNDWNDIDTYANALDALKRQKRKPALNREGKRESPVVTEKQPEAKKKAPVVAQAAKPVSRPSGFPKGAPPVPPRPKLPAGTQSQTGVVSKASPGPQTPSPTGKLAEALRLVELAIQNGDLTKTAARKFVSSFQKPSSTSGPTVTRPASPKPSADS